MFPSPQPLSCPVGYGCRIYQLLLFRGVRLLPMSVLDMILNNGEIPVMLELWEMWSIPFFAIAPGSTLV